jgi:hypothetical protein
MWKGSSCSQLMRPKESIPRVERNGNLMEETSYSYKTGDRCIVNNRICKSLGAYLHLPLRKEAFFHQNLVRELDMLDRLSHEFRRESGVGRTVRDADSFFLSGAFHSLESRPMHPCVGFG